MNTIIKPFLKLRNSKNEEVYTIDNVNGNLLISPLKPIISIFDTLTLYKGNTNIGEINLSEMLLNSVNEMFENNYSEDLTLEGELNNLFKNITVFARDVNECFSDFTIDCGGYIEPNTEQVLKSLLANKIDKYNRTEPKTGRNELCPCGSGKKYKHCCLK